MIYLSHLKPFKIDYSCLVDITYFYRMSEYILAHFVSDDYSIKILPQDAGVVPAYGMHYGGFFVEVKNMDRIQKLICHTGLVYYPDTEIGICFETESWGNSRIYKKLWQDVEPSPGYSLNKDESDFIKFMLPMDKVDTLMNADTIDEQIDILTRYYDACFTGILKAANK